MNAKQVIDLFVEQGFIDSGLVEDILQETSRTGKGVVQTLADFGLFGEEEFYQRLAEILGTEVVDLSAMEITPEIARLLPGGLARLHGAMPIGMSGNSIAVCLVDPLNPQIPEDLRFAVGKDIHVVIAPTYQIEECLEKTYGVDSSNMDQLLSELGADGIEF